MDCKGPSLLEICPEHGATPRPGRTVAVISGSLAETVSTRTVSSAGSTILWEFKTSTNQWAWISGSKSNQSTCALWSLEAETVCGQPGVYGQMGSPGGIPGGRYFPLTWADQDGHLWLFGGLELDSVGQICSLDDLWEFNPSTSQWTWQDGSDLAANTNQVFPLTQAVYGLPGVPQAGNTPGGRAGGGAWTDHSGHFWLFAGSGLNDLWEFDPASKQWTWMAGSSYYYLGTGPPGVYGRLGAPTLQSAPGTRTNFVDWTDSFGNLWLWGGDGPDSNPTESGGLDDLWEFIPSANEWVWMGGSDKATAADQSPPGIYGTLGIPSSSNLPGKRTLATSWSDASGSAWLFGGDGVDSAGTFGYLNDLWRYVSASPSTPPTPGFGVYATPNTAAVQQGDSITFTVRTFTGGGFNSPVLLTATSLGGATATVVPPSVTGAATSQMTVTTSSSTLVGTNNVTVSGASGGVTETSAVSLSVTTEPQPPDFTLYSPQNYLSIKPGTQGTIVLTVTPVNGFNSPVSFNCSGLPAGVTCSFNPSSITPSDAAVATLLTMAASPQAELGRMPLRRPPSPITVLALAAGLFGWATRRRFGPILLAVTLLAGLGALTSCGGSGKTGAEESFTPESANVTVTASSGSIQRATVISVAVY